VTVTVTATEAVTETATATATATETEAATVTEAATEVKRKPRQRHKKPPERPDQGEATRLRLHFEKLGRAAFASHLDLVRVLPRLFRRLELPLYYSKGYHPKPQLVFGPALSLGISSLVEYVDVKITRQAALDLEQLPTALSEAAVDGVRFVGVAELQPEDGKLNWAIDEGHYVAAVPRSALAAHGLHDEAAIVQRITERRAGSLQVRRVIEGIGKRVDVGQYLLAAEVGEGGATLARVGLQGDLLPVRIKLRITPNGTAKPSEALEALLGDAELPVRFVREALLWVRGDERGTPMDLAALRAADARLVPAREPAADAQQPSAPPAP
jgi:radical SAM-linked protein